MIQPLEHVTANAAHPGDDRHPATAVDVAFDPLVATAVDVRAHRQIARDIATANRHAGLDRRLLDADLRGLDEQIRRRSDVRAVDVALAEQGLGAAAGLFDRARPAASPAPRPRQDRPTESTPHAAPRRAPSTGRQPAPARHTAPPTPTAPGTTDAPSTRRSPEAATPPVPAPAGGRSMLPSGSALTVLPGARPVAHTAGHRGGGPNPHSGPPVAPPVGRSPRARAARPVFQMQRGPLPQRAQRHTLDGIMKILQARHAQGRSVVKLRLTPPELGTLTVELKLKGTAMTLRFATHSADVRDLLHGHAAELADALRAQGLQLERCDIDIIQPPDAHATVTGGQDHSAHTDASADGRPDAAGAEGAEAEEPDAALTEAVEQGLIAAGRVDIRA